MPSSNAAIDSSNESPPPSSRSTTLERRWTRSSYFSETAGAAESATGPSSSTGSGWGPVPWRRKPPARTPSSRSCGTSAFLLVHDPRGDLSFVQADAHTLARRDLRRLLQDMPAGIERHRVAAGEHAQRRERVQPSCQDGEAVPARGPRALPQRPELLIEAGDLPLQPVQPLARMLLRKSLAEGAQAVLARGELLGVRALEPLAQAIQPELTLADQAPGIGDARSRLVQLRPLPLQLRPQRALQAGPALREIGRELALHPRDQLRGGGGGGRAHVGAEVRDGEVHLVADGAHHRHRAGGDGARHHLLVEGPQVFQAAAA